MNCVVPAAMQKPYRILKNRMYVIHMQKLNRKLLGKIKLLKLLYSLDFCHFKQTGMSVTGIDYFAWEMGLVKR